MFFKCRNPKYDAKSQSPKKTGNSTIVHLIFLWAKPSWNKNDTGRYMSISYHKELISSIYTLLLQIDKTNVEF